MARTNAAAVKAVLMRDYDSRNAPSVEPFILMATELVSDLVDSATDAGVTIRASKLERIECLLAAHFYCQSDRPLDSKKTDGAGGTFSGKTGKRFDSTMYGQSAMAMDTTGYLTVVGTDPAVSGGGSGGGGFASGFSLGDDDTTSDNTNDSGAVPTIDASAVNRNALATTYYIEGTGFDSVAANNTVEFNLGAEGTVTAATATRLTITMTTLPTGTGNLVARVSTAGGTSEEQQVATVVSAALVAHWLCNEGSGDTLNDSVGNADLSLQAGGERTWNADTPGSQAGSGGCVSAVAPGFDSVSALFTGSQSSSWPSGNDTFSVSFWSKLKGTASAYFMYGNGPSLQVQRSLNINDQPVVGYVITVDTDNNDILDTAFFIASSDPTSEVWDHIVLTWNGEEWTCYLGGSEDASEFCAELVTNADGSVHLLLSAGDGYARLKDVRFYNCDLTAAQVSSLYSTGSI